jgi:hypothetical protein
MAKLVRPLLAGQETCQDAWKEREKIQNEVEATEIVLPEASSELDFHGWFITIKGMGSKYGRA